MRYINLGFTYLLFGFISVPWSAESFESLEARD